MIRIGFVINREPFKLEIKDGEIFYTDRTWKRAIRLIPKDKDFIMKIKMSRNKIPNSLIQCFELTPREQEEYDNAKDDGSLADICVKDIKVKGAIGIVKQVID